MNGIWKKGMETIRKEWRTMMKFLVVGGSTFLLKAGIYAVLSRVIWESGSRSVQNVLALTIATVYNFVFHRYWTFDHLKPAPGSAKRYSIVLIVGFLMEAVLFYVGHGILGFYDFYVITFNTAFISMISFVTHRLFTFHPDPYKRKPDVVQSS